MMISDSAAMVVPLAFTKSMDECVKHCRNNTGMIDMMFTNKCWVCDEAC